MLNPIIATTSAQIIKVTSNPSFLDQFFPNFWATIVGVFLGGYISYKLIRYQLKKEAKDNYASILKSIFSEFQENDRLFRQGKSFNLKLTGLGEYKLTLVLVNKTILSGALSTEKLGVHANHKLISSLATVERRVAMHNLIVSKIMDMISTNFSSQLKPAFEWLINNLKEKQKVLRDDFKTMLPVLLTEIAIHSERKQSKQYFRDNKKVEKAIKAKT